MRSRAVGIGSCDTTSPDQKAAIDHFHEKLYTVNINFGQPYYIDLLLPIFSALEQFPLI